MTVVISRLMIELVLLGYRSLGHWAYAESEVSCRSDNTDAHLYIFVHRIN